MRPETDPYLEGVIKLMEDKSAEMSVLNVLLTNPNTYYETTDRIFENLFFYIEHRLIYRCIKMTAEAGKTIDIITVSDMARTSGIDEESKRYRKEDSILRLITGMSMNYSAYGWLQLQHHVDILHDMYKRRRVLEISNQAQQKCKNLDNSDEIIDFINAEVLSLSLNQVDEFNAKTTVNDVLSEMKNPTPKRIQKSGILKLDEFIFGFEYGDQCVIGGAASMGKTAFALRLFQNFIDAGCCPVYFSLEMSKAQLITRLVASEGEIHLNNIRRRQLLPYQIKRLEETGQKLAAQKFIIDDKSRSIEKIINNMRIFKIKYGTRVVIVDYLQLVNANIGKGGNREQEIAKISRALKEAAVELDMIMFPLSQLSREVGKRGNHKPTLSDLRESGSIEQDADFVLFPFRQSYYDMIDGKISKPDFCEQAELIIAKGRSTGTGIVSLKFISTFTKYLNDEDEPPKDITEADQKTEQQTEFKAESNDDVPF